MDHQVRTAGKTEDDVLAFSNAWTGLDRRRQVTAILAGLVVFAGILLMSRLATRPSYELLYSGLESGAAGEVVRALEQQGAMFQVRGGSIYVEGAMRDELRMTLASAGLPANGGKGYELLDSLSGFGTTSQMFDAAYWRAKEGELARTIVSASYISRARVHIANTGTNPFRRSAETSASVSITASGAQVSAAQAEALRHLVASAVAGLKAENVTVVDDRGNLIGSEDKASGASTALNRADDLRARVSRLVEARVGKGNAFVEVSVDTITQTETVRQRLLDPAGRVAISTDIEERADNSTSRNGDVSVSSNLPDGDAGGDGSKATASQTRERVNYEVSETEREIRKTPGQVRRLTVAVLVNGAPDAAGDGSEAFTPRPEEELAALRALVESAVGYDAERGDVITIKSMALPEVAPLGTEATASWRDRVHVDVMALAQMAILALVTLLTGLFVVRPLLSRAPDPLALPSMAPPETRSGDVRMGAGDTPDVATALPGAEVATLAGSGTPETSRSSTPDTQSTLPVPTDTTAPVDRLRAMIGERQEETVEILRGWLDEQREEA